MKQRRIKLRYILIFLSILVGITALIHHSNQQKKVHDDILLSDMDRIIYFAQRALSETGDLPDDLHALNVTVMADAPDLKNMDVVYKKSSASELLLCGRFKRKSAGQVFIEGSDYRYNLPPDLTVDRPKKGEHCYEIELERMDENIRHDALLYREINQALTIMECAYWAKGMIQNLEASKKVSRSMRERRVCFRHRTFLGQSGQVPTFKKTGDASIRACAEFRAVYRGAGLSAVFEPAEKSHFAELAANRLSPGEYCYDIDFLRPDPAMPEPLTPWDLPFSYQITPEKMTDEQENDKRAIGDMVNVIRLARCAFSLGEGLPGSFEAALERVRSRSEALTRRYQCDWGPRYYGQSSRKAEVSYEKTGPDQIKVCADFNQAWDNPLALNYFGRAVFSWPGGLHELQKPVAGPGRHCVDVRLTKIGSGSY